MQKMVKKNHNYYYFDMIKNLIMLRKIEENKL